VLELGLLCLLMPSFAVPLLLSAHRATLVATLHIAPSIISVVLILHLITQRTHRRSKVLSYCRVYAQIIVKCGMWCGCSSGCGPVSALT